ncbi:AraC family transcriptional regulator [Paenibacillus pabuli]|uniref:AraC family transcriptional regulator n=1 Tax=Paenibacillus pabuli TaxID=1472 RepID=UPI000783E496|nr:AraC family transcriptional regulator [Paenibacillus pabuli]MEC0127648.1 AraC family transcriptional regulator [Paenibacillus pabuli]
MQEEHREVQFKRFDKLDHLHFKLLHVDHPGASDCVKEWCLRKHFLDTYMLLFMASGQGFLTVDGNFIELCSGALYIGLPGQLVEANVHSLDERGMYHMNFDVMHSADHNECAALDTVKQLLGDSCGSEVICASSVAVGLLCQTIYQQARSNNGLQRYYAQICFLELLYTLFNDVVRAEGRFSTSPAELAKDYIEQNYMNKITIHELAAVARMSSRHFMRLFKKRYGCSAVDYLTFFRIKQAQIIMRNDHSYRLKDIASYVGYQDEMYFRRKFKQISGIAPAAFIQGSKQKIAAVHSLSIGTLLALQIIPCAAKASHPWTEYYRRKYETDKVMPLGEVEAIWLEQLRMVDPDYIITVEREMSDTLAHQLRSIAPVCIIPQEKGDWRDHLKYVARFLDRSDVAEVWLQRYDEKSAMVRTQLAGHLLEERLLVLRVHGEVLQVLGPRSIASVFYVDMQMNGPEGVEAFWELGTVKVTELLKLSIDRMLLIVEEDEKSKQTWSALRNSKAWNDTTAVQNGCIDILMPSVLLDYTAFTHELMLDEVLKIWQDRP